MKTWHEQPWQDPYRSFADEGQQLLYIQDEVRQKWNEIPRIPLVSMSQNNECEEAFVPFDFAELEQQMGSFEDANAKWQAAMLASSAWDDVEE